MTLFISDSHYLRFSFNCQKCAFYKCLYIVTIDTMLLLGPNITTSTTVIIIENLCSPSKHGRTINNTNRNTYTNQIKTKQLQSGQKTLEAHFKFRHIYYYHHHHHHHHHYCHHYQPPATQLFMYLVSSLCLCIYM